MKKPLLTLGLCMLLALVACKKDDVIDDPNTTTPPETGVSFTCKDSVGLADVLVGISPQAADRDSGIFLRSGFTDNLGKIKFVNLNPQLFYYSATRTTNQGGIVKRYGSVEVVQDVKKLVTVNF
jgi:hypothetical protein